MLGASSAARIRWLLDDVLENENKNPDEATARVASLVLRP